MPALAPSVSGPVCNPVQSQASPVCITGYRPVSVAGGCLKSPLERPGRLCLSPDGPSKSPLGRPGRLCLSPDGPSEHQVVTKLLDHGFRRLILIAPGWPNMPWFWDLVNMSVQIPLLLPQVSNLITQPFNQCPHRDLANLNLHAWLLEPLPSNKQVSLQKWQQELRLLKDALPEPFMSQSGPFLSDGVRRIRWTSGHPL